MVVKTSSYVAPCPNKPDSKLSGPLVASEVTVCGITPVHIKDKVSPRLIVIFCGLNPKSNTSMICNSGSGKIISAFSMLQVALQSETCI